MGGYSAGSAFTGVELGVGAGMDGMSRARVSPGVVPGVESGVGLLAG